MNVTGLTTDGWLTGASGIATDGWLSGISAEVIVAEVFRFTARICTSIAESTPIVTASNITAHIATAFAWTSEILTSKNINTPITPSIDPETDIDLEEI